MALTQHFFIGVDGGATKCVVRLENEAGDLLGQERGGPANICISVEQAWYSIDSALNRILKALAISREDKDHRFHVGMGLAGCERIEAYQAFLKQAAVFSTLRVTSDAHVACLGAHRGQDGAIIMVGTGVVGYQLCAGKTSRVSGWGFPHDDEGGGAWIGLQAVMLTLQWLDGRRAESGLAKTIYAHFKQNQASLVDWANRANASALAELAPLVIQQAEQYDGSAIVILQQAAQAIDRVGSALFRVQADQKTILPCAVAGGLAPFLQPLLALALRVRLRPCLSTPEVGAILLVRKYRAEKEEGYE